MAAKRDYYEVLGVQKGASADEIKKPEHLEPVRRLLTFEQEDRKACSKKEAPEYEAQSILLEEE